MVSNEKAVYFDFYCKRCLYEKKSELGEPCFECLAHPVNWNSHKPVNYEEKE